MITSTNTIHWFNGLHDAIKLRNITNINKFFNISTTFVVFLLDILKIISLKARTNLSYHNLNQN